MSTLSRILMSTDESSSLLRRNFNFSLFIHHSSSCDSGVGSDEASAKREMNQNSGSRPSQMLRRLKIGDGSRRMTVMMTRHLAGA